ncbi:MAG TPA: hypothetical protein VG406_20360 [Isosphaeraceae bacterium]|jgi:hypothetical protein|nr:hypothetical protein [Isosphaeraceae bacterium]
MLDEARVARVLRLHEMSYALLRWVQAALREGRLSFDVVHDAGDSAAAAEEWIRRHRANLPLAERPAEPDVPAFVCLFVSFLKTSFRLNADSTRLVSDRGCRCPFCSYLQAGPRLEPRTPSRKHAESARALERIYLTRLASELPTSPPSELVEAIVDVGDLRESVALATWGAEMLRRAEFASQGEAVLALWRAFAWKDGRPRKDFKLTARALCAAERRVRDALLQATREVLGATRIRR